MSGFDPILSSDGGVFHLGRRPGLASLVGQLKSADWTTAVVDGRMVTTKESLLTALDRELAFPDWFGQNWDALADALSERSRVALIVDHAPQGHAMEMLIEIVDDLHRGGQAIMLITRRR